MRTSTAKYFILECTIDGIDWYKTSERNKQLTKNVQRAHMYRSESTAKNAASRAYTRIRFRVVPVVVTLELYDEQAEEL